MFFYITIVGVTRFRSYRNWYLNNRKTSSSSIKMAEDGSLFDIFSWPSLKPGSMSAIHVKGVIQFLTMFFFSERRLSIPINLTDQKKSVPRCLITEDKGLINMQGQIRIRCDKIIGLFFLLMSVQYSLASTLTFLWSMPNWQMSAYKGKGIIRANSCHRFMHTAVFRL